MGPKHLEMDVPDPICAQSPTAQDAGGDHSINGRRACLSPCLSTPALGQSGELRRGSRTAWGRAVHVGTATGHTGLSQSRAASVRGRLGSVVPSRGEFGRGRSGGRRVRALRFAPSSWDWILRPCPQRLGEAGAEQVREA